MPTTKRVGFMLIFFGILFFGVSTGAFTTIDADRGVSVHTAPNNAALIALEPTENTINDQNDPTLVGQIRNNFDQPVTVTFNVDSDYNGVNPDPENGEEYLLPGETIDLEATCEPPDGGQGATDITVVFDADGGNVSVSDGTLTTAPEYDCPGRNGPPGGGGPGDQPDGDIEFESLTVTVTGTGGPNNTPTEVEFTYELSEDADVEFGIVDGNRENAELIEGTTSGTITLASGEGGQPSGGSATVSGDIVEGEECSEEIEAGDENVPVCGRG